MQSADFHGLLLGQFADTGFLAQGLSRTDAGAHAAENIAVKDGLGSGFRRACGDLTDEKRDVDAGRTSGDAGRVVAEVTAISGDLRLVWIKRRMHVAEVIFERLGIETPGDDAILINRGQSSHGTLNTLVSFKLQGCHA